MDKEKRRGYSDLLVSAGVDIVPVERVSAAANAWGERFLNRVWTAQEIGYCQGKQNPFEHLAARFAAKEAVSKSLALTWDKGLKWKEISIVNNGTGVPEVKLSGETRRVAAKLEVKSISLSMSHCRDYAVAYVTVVRGPGKGA